MKGVLLFTAILALALLVIPLLAIRFDTTPVSTAPEDSPGAPSTSLSSQTPVPWDTEDMPSVSAAPDSSEAAAAPALSYNGVESFRILNESTGRVDTVSVRDYVRGAVASEMPVSFHPEALKAQAVAAHTYALHNHQVQQRSPDPELMGADFAADPEHMLVYTTETRVREFYGADGDAAWEKICEAADSVLTWVMEYEEQPIVAAYHAISAGQTEAASNVWIGEAPYLQPSDSEGDLLAPDYETVLSLPASYVGEALRTAWPAADLTDPPDYWFTNVQRSDSGYITSITVGGVEVHGKDLRTLFELRSHNIDIEYSSATEYFTFYVYGYGHGVGLSQYGADFLARQGYTFDEILRNYYTGISLKQMA